MKKTIFVSIISVEFNKVNNALIDELGASHFPDVQAISYPPGEWTKLSSFDESKLDAALLLLKLKYYSLGSGSIIKKEI